MKTSIEQTLMRTACDQAWAILQTALLLPSGDTKETFKAG